MGTDGSGTGTTDCADAGVVGVEADGAETEGARSSRSIIWICAVGSAACIACPKAAMNRRYTPIPSIDFGPTGITKYRVVCVVRYCSMLLTDRVRPPTASAVTVKCRSDPTDTRIPSGASPRDPQALLNADGLARDPDDLLDRQRGVDLDPRVRELVLLCHQAPSCRSWIGYSPMRTSASDATR